METRTVEYKGSSIEVNVPEAACQGIDALNVGGRGRFGYVLKHTSGVPGERGCIQPKVSSFWMTTCPRYDLYRARVRAHLNEVELPHVTVALEDRFNILRQKAELQKVSLPVLFAEAKTAILESLDKTDSGDRSDGHRQGHDNCYAHVGIATLHLVTVKDAEKRKTPVIAENGLMTVEGVMIPNYIIDRDEHSAGEWKPVDSKILTIMKDGIMSVLKQYGVREWKTLNLAKGNFSLVTFNSTQVYGYVRETKTAGIDAKIADFIQHIAALPTDPWTVLRMEAQEMVDVFTTVTG